MTAVLVLMEYLTDTAVAPLQRDFVELDDPFCNDVRYSIIENSQGLVYLKFKNVPKGKLGSIKERLFALLEKLGDKTEEFDMKRMESVIHRRVLESMNHLEDSPHDTVAFNIIGDFLYGDKNEDLETRLNQITTFKNLKKETVDFWVELVNTYLVGTKYACIVGDPSTKLMEEMGKSEKERVEKQRKSLGEDGMKNKGEILEKATQDNEKEPPESMLTSVDVPDVGCIHFHKIGPSSNLEAAKANSNAKFPLGDIPVTFQLDDIQTNFVNVTVMMDTAKLSADLRQYLPLYSEVILESPIMRNGELISHEDVITELAADTLYNDCSVGIDGGRFTVGKYGSQMVLNLKVELEKYKKGAQWVKELLYQVEFTTDRLNIIASKMVNEVASMKRSGTTIVRCVFKDLIYSKESNEHISSMMRQHKFLSNVMEKLDKEDQAKMVLADMKKIQEVITDPNNLRIHVAASVETLAKMTEPQEIWKQDIFPKEVQQTAAKPTVKQAFEFLFPPTEGPGSGVIVGVGSVESSFLIQSTPCINDFNHPDLPAILVFTQYLIQLEGPMWRQIRGLGLSYSFSMYLKEEEGLMYFLLYRASHLVNAYKKAKEIVDDYISGKTQFSEVEFEACKSSLIFEIIESEQTPSDASKQSMLSYLRGISKDYNRQLIQKIPKVTLADMKKIAGQYFTPLFDTARSKVAICCHPTKVEEICKDMKEVSRDLTVMDSLEESFLAEP